MNTEICGVDLAETMQNLQTIAEQYLPESWENEVNPVNGDNSTNSNNFNLIETLVKCQFCGDLFKGNDFFVLPTFI